MPDTPSYREGSNAYPYRILARPHAAPRRMYPRDISHMSGYSGHFQCSLDVHTPLEVNYRKGAPFSRDPKIPGSSLKGVLRSLAEFIGGGCISVGQADPLWATCDGEMLCPTCLLFGNMTRGKDSVVLRGLVRISEARPIEIEGRHMIESFPVVELYQSSPKDRHTAFYPRQSSHQKFYHHHPSKSQYPKKLEQKHVSKLYPVAPGSRFGFRIDFVGLDADLLALLHYCVALEPGLLHKMGRGKAHGLGSVKLHIDSLEFEDARSRYTGEGESFETLTPEIEEKRQAIASDPATDALRRMLCYAGHRGLSFKYPSHTWFQNHSTVPLRRVDELLPTFDEEPELQQDPPLPSIKGSHHEPVVPVDTTPSWTTKELWESAEPSYHSTALSIAGLHPYSRGKKSSLPPLLSRFQETQDERPERQLLLDAFRQMFSKERDFRSFCREVLSLEVGPGDGEELPEDPMERLEALDEESLAEMGRRDLGGGKVPDEALQAYAQRFRERLEDAGIWGSWSEGSKKEKKWLAVIDGLIEGKSFEQAQESAVKVKKKGKKRKKKK